MAISDERTKLRIELDTKQCHLFPGEWEKMENSLGTLKKLIADFPISDLYITIYHFPQTGQYNVHTSLVLTGKTLFTADQDRNRLPAFERCVRKLIKKVQAYKASLGNVAEQAKHQKATHQEVVPDREPDPARLEEAVESGDYAAFRLATFMYEEPVRKRVGRWVQRYPQVDSQIGERLKLDDIVEEVFLNAFEQYPNRPAQVRLGDWLESLIDPSLRALLENPDAEIENVQLARTWRETAVSPQAGAP